LVLLFIVAAVIATDNLFSQNNTSQPILLTPNTNDLDDVSSLRAIAPPISSVPEQYYSRPVDHKYENYIKNEQFREHGQDKFEKERSSERVADRNNYIYRQNSSESGEYVPVANSMQPRKYPPNNGDPNPNTPNPNALSANSRLNESQREIPPQDRSRLERSDGDSPVMRTANMYPSTFDRDSHELVNSRSTLGGVRNDLPDKFSSNRVVPFNEQVPVKLDLTPSYKDDLPFVRVCGVVVVQANFPISEVELQLLEIEKLQRDLSNYLGLSAPNEKIELCLFRDEASYTKFLVAKFANAPRDRRALYIKKNNSLGTVLVQRLKDFEIDLRHEMTHAIVHASIPVVPIWLDEGLAKYFELPAQDRFNSNPYIKQVRKNMKFGIFAVPSLSRLEKLALATDMGDAEYRDSWAWVHFMFHHSEKTHRMLAGYLKLLASLPQEKYKDKNGNVKVPNLSLYLEDFVENPRQQFRKHFQNK
jgi:hypothetical protein